MKKLRLLFTPNCDRSCKGCCNKDWNLDELPVFWSSNISEFIEVLITGGEPLLYPDELFRLCKLLKLLNPNVKLFIYTAYTKMWDASRLRLFDVVDGFTITIHNQKSANEFVKTEKILNLNCSDYTMKSLRLNIFKGCVLPYPDGYVVKDNMVLIKDCPLPTDEVFMRY